MLAGAGKFNDGTVDGKAFLAGRRVQAVGGFPFNDLRHIAADVTNKQSRWCIIVIFAARHIGVAAFDLVHKVMSLQEVQSPVNGDRSRPCTSRCHTLDDFVGTDGRMAFCHANQHVSTLFRKPGTFAHADALGMANEIGGATGMIVVGGGETHACYIIT